MSGYEAPYGPQASGYVQASPPGYGPLAGGYKLPPKSPYTQSPSLSDTPVDYTGQAMMGMGAIASTAGTVIQAISGYYAAKIRQTQLRSQASAARFRQTMAGINASQAEDDARELMRVMQFEREKLGLRAGQEYAKTRTSAAARGVSIGVGSTAEVEASQRVIASIEDRVITRNGMQAVTNKRIQAINMRTGGAVAGVNASNYEASAAGISPALGGINGFLSSAPTTGALWAEYARRY